MAPAISHRYALRITVNKLAFLAHLGSRRVPSVRAVDRAARAIFVGSAIEELAPRAPAARRDHRRGLDGLAGVTRGADGELSLMQVLRAYECVLPTHGLSPAEDTQTHVLLQWSLNASTYDGWRAHLHAAASSSPRASPLSSTTLSSHMRRLPPCLADDLAAAAAHILGRRTTRRRAPPQRDVLTAGIARLERLATAAGPQSSLSSRRAAKRAPSPPPAAAMRAGGYANGYTNDYDYNYAHDDGQPSACEAAVERWSGRRGGEARRGGGRSEAAVIEVEQQWSRRRRRWRRPPALRRRADAQRARPPSARRGGIAAEARAFGRAAGPSPRSAPHGPARRSSGTAGTAAAAAGAACR